MAAAANARPVKRDARRSGFTLVQLMVALAIIAVLIAMILVGVVGVRHAATRMQCMNNLRQIGAAYANYVDKNHNDPLSFKADHAWVGILKPWVQGNEGVFFCPVDDRPSFAEDIPKAFIRVNQNVFPEYGNTRNIPIAKNGRRMRESARYTQNDPPGTYYLEMEDWEDWNWRDLDIKYWPAPDGSGFNVQPVGWTGAAYTFDLMAADGTTMLYQNFKPPNFPIITIPGGMSRSSYAISSQVRFLGTGDADKVLAVEYSGKVVANVFGPSAPDYWPTTAAPRHRGTLNVLMHNGAIKTMTSADLDPRDSAIYPRHWLPTSPGPF